MAEETLEARAKAAHAAANRVRRYLQGSKQLRQTLIGPIETEEDPILKDIDIIADFTGYAVAAFDDPAVLVAFIRGEDRPYKRGF